MPETKVKFGFAQIKQQTPAWATNVFRVVLYTCAIGTIGVATFTAIPEHIKLQVAVACSQVTLFVHALSKMFGLDVKGPADQSANNGQSQ